MDNNFNEVMSSNETNEVAYYGYSEEEMKKERTSSLGKGIAIGAGATAGGFILFRLGKRLVKAIQRNIAAKKEAEMEIIDQEDES